MNTMRSEPIEHLTENPTEFVKRLNESGKPVMLFIAGKAALIVQSAEEFQSDREMNWSEVEEVKSGMQEAEKGLGKPASEVLGNLLQSQESRL